MKYRARYYVEIDPGVIKAGGFAGFSGSRAWTFQTRAAPPAAKATLIVVAADGSGDFTTVQGAVDFVPDTPRSRVTIFIRRGRYEEIVYFRNKREITFLGEDRDGVVIGYANNEIFNGPPPGVRTNERPGTFPYRRAAFMADASTGIHVVNLTLRNFTPLGGSQAEALLLMGGKNIVSHVNAYSHQDTVQFNDAIYVCRQPDRRRHRLLVGTRSGAVRADDGARAVERPVHVGSKHGGQSRVRVHRLPLRDAGQHG